ncbi:MAG: polysaccharide biosynthesis tyrosine autokinase [Armatimonadetes bacterium]|nr:polysaccharide biosynthesis tyrosine autokinase [Armatimonadota bacterium]
MASNDYFQYGDNGNGQSRLPSRTGQFTPARPQPYNADMVRLQRTLRGVDEKKNKLQWLDYVGLLWRGKWIILACLIVMGSLAAWYTYSLPFIYESSLQVLVNEKDQSIGLLNNPNYWGNTDRELKKELQILTSRPIFEKTATRLIALRFTDTAKRETVLPLLTIVEAQYGGLSTAANASPERQNRVVDALVESLRRIIEVKPSKDADVIQVVTRTGDPNEAALIANTFAEVYIKDNKDQNSRKATQIRQFVADKMEKVRDSLAIIELHLKDYLESKNILGLDMQASDLVQAKSKLDNDASQTQIQTTTLARKLQEAKQQYQAVDTAFAQEFASGDWVYASQLQTEIAKLKTERDLMLSVPFDGASKIAYDQKKKVISDQMTLLESKLSPVVARMKNSNVGALMTTTKQGEMPTAPLGNMRQQIFEDEVALQALRAQSAAINAARAQVVAQMSAVPQQQMDVDRLMREKSASAKMYENMLDEYNKKVLEEQSVTSTARIFEDAQPVLKPVSPNRTANILTGAFLGLAIGVGIALLLAYSDTTVHSPDDLEKHGFTVLTAIPLIPETMLNYDISKDDPLAVRLNGRASSHLITHIQPKAPISESYRSLRTAVQFAAIEEPVRKILVASSVPQEGKSTTSTNLAITLAQSGARTLLIDCDLRRPTQNSVFGFPREPGLVNCLIGMARLDEAIRPSGIPNLDVLSSGSIPPNPSELIGSRRMRELLTDLEKDYDMILIDSPPIGAVTDAMILSTMTDTTILVVRAHKTKMEFLEKSREGLERVNTPLLGVVLNDFDVSQTYGSASYKYYRYYRYYNYYGGMEEQEEASRRKDRRAKAIANGHQAEEQPKLNG